MEKIVFRHYKEMMFDPNMMSNKEAGEALKEDCFKNGYVPMNLFFRDDFDELKVEQTGYRIASVICGYAGKKKAREIGYLENNQTEIVIPLDKK